MDQGRDHGALSESTVRGSSLPLGIVSLDEEIGDVDEARHELLEGCRPEDQEAVLTEAGEIGRLRDRLEAVMDIALNDRERVIFEARFFAEQPPMLNSERNSACLESVFVR